MTAKLYAQNIVRTATFQRSVPADKLRNQAVSLYPASLADNFLITNVISTKRATRTRGEISPCSCFADRFLLVDTNARSAQAVRSSPCSFEALCLLFAQKPRFCASALGIHFLRRRSRNDRVRGACDSLVEILRVV